MVATTPPDPDAGDGTLQDPPKPEDDEGAPEREDADAGAFPYDVVFARGGRVALVPRGHGDAFLEGLSAGQGPPTTWTEKIEGLPEAPVRGILSGHALLGSKAKRVAAVLGLRAEPGGRRRRGPRAAAAARAEEQEEAPQKKEGNVMTERPTERPTHSLLSMLEPIAAKVAELDPASATDDASAKKLAAALDDAMPFDGEDVRAIGAEIRRGIAEGWLCDRGESDARFSRVAKPGPQTAAMSVDVVSLVGPALRHTHPQGRGHDGLPRRVRRGRGPRRAASTDTRRAGS